jgi:DNA-binding SARP family transcriptional activator
MSSTRRVKFGCITLIGNNWIRPVQKRLHSENSRRLLGIVGSLGMHPITRLSIPVRRLFVFLAISKGPVERAVAAARLWPDRTDQVARSNLRRTLFQAPAGWILCDADDLVLDADIDLTAARASALRGVSGAQLVFEEITALTEDILPGWHEDWLIPTQDSFRLLRVQALETACRTLSASGQFALAIQAGAAAVLAEPLNESAAEALILAHLAQRNRFQAVQCYRALAERLGEELGVEPDPQLSCKLKAIVGGLPLH